MKKNVGSTDRWIRIVLGVALLVMALVVKADWRWLGLIGIIPLATGLLNYCPLYSLFGLSTNKDKGNTK